MPFLRRFQNIHFSHFYTLAYTLGPNTSFPNWVNENRQFLEYRKDFNCSVKRKTFLTRLPSYFMKISIENLTLFSPVVLAKKNRYGTYAPNPMATSNSLHVNIKLEPSFSHHLCFCTFKTHCRRPFPHIFIFQRVFAL